MTTRTTIFALGEYYHVYNRGNSKQKIFLSPSDYERFLNLLYICNTSEQFNLRDLLKSFSSIYEIERPDHFVRIGAFCIMPNHFHLLLSPITENGLSKFMLKLGTAYSMYFNTKYERTGSLFEGRYKTKHIDSDQYLKYLFSYIHLNPVTDKLTRETEEQVYKKHHLTSIKKTQDTYERASAFPYSSLRDYIDPTSPRAALGLVDTSIYNMYFDNEQSIKRELFDWLEYQNEV